MYAIVNHDTGDLIVASEDRSILEEYLMDEFMEDFQWFATQSYDDWVEDYADHEEISIEEAAKAIDENWYGQFRSLALEAWDVVSHWYDSDIEIVEVDVI